MKPWHWMALTIGLSAGCGKRGDRTSSGAKSHEGSGSAAATTAGDPTKGDPTTPPPPPTVKPGGKGDCKTDYAPRPKRDPNPMCKVAGGTFTMTEKITPKMTDSMTITLSPYYIDQFEVTVAQVALYLNTTHADQCVDPDDPRGRCFNVAGPEGDRGNGRFIRKLADGTYHAEPGTERFPFSGVSRQGAKNYCAWVGKALPTEPQWEFAARHDPQTGKDYLYPWGDEFDGTRARCDHDECPNGPDNDDPAEVGTYDGTHGHGDGRSPWGVFEMAGNVNEVVADCAHNYEPCNGGPCKDPPPAPPQKIVAEPPPPPPGTACGVITRGGSREGPEQLRTINRGEYLLEGFRCARPGP